jgi:hypothetical protein
MQKHVYFHSFKGDFWPRLDQIEHNFLAPNGSGWVSVGGNDSWSIDLQGLEGTEDRPFGRGRKDINLMMWGTPGLGVLIMYDKIGPPDFRATYYSRGDMSRLRELVESTHSDELPVGLFIPFEKAWLAVKEFMETEGQRPACIEWVRHEDLPPKTFPSP